MAWQNIGTVTISPESEEVIVGPIVVPAYGGFEVRVRLLSGPHPFQFGYGLLSYRSAFGKELGTIKVWPKNEYEDYSIGAGMTAQDTAGVLTFEPRTWNLRWVKAGFSLVVQVLADLASDLATDRYTVPGFTDTSQDLILTQVGNLGQLVFTP